MSADGLTPDGWRRLLAQLEDPAVGQVAEALAGARDLPVGDAYDLVEDAIDDGLLEEDTDASAFGAVRVSNSGVRISDGSTETDESEETPESNTEEPDSDGSNPTLEAVETDERDGETDPTDADGPAGAPSWFALDFSATEGDTYPPELLEREQWMGRLEGKKLPFSPWADRDHPEAAPDDDARYKWGLPENYVDGDTVAIAEDDPRLDGRVFIQLDDDPYAFVDGDDVRCPDTGDVHPAFTALLEHLGATYADVSTSGTGVHAYYRGELPIDGKGQATFPIDTEPWGANDTVPAVEIYANKHVNVATGDHVVGTPLAVNEWDDDALRAILEANGYDDKPEVSHDTDRERPDLDGYEPGAVDVDDTADDVRDILYAVDRLTPADLPLRARRVGEDSTGWTTWDPSYRPSESGESLHYNGEGVFHDHKEGEAFGVLGLFAAEEGIIHDPWDRLDGAEWWEAVEAARDAGAPIPEFDDGGDEEYRRDPREVDATVDPRRAWDAAGRVTPDEVDGLHAAESAPERFACPATGDPVDVVRAVAIAEELLERPDAPLDDVYPDAYALAREEYGAPLPEYYTTADAIAEFDAVRDVIAEATFWDLEVDALDTEVTAEGDDVGGDAVRALNPAWRESESEASVLVFDNGTIWDADTERVLDVVRFAALDAGEIDDPTDELAGSTFTDAYAVAREEYGAPLPRWEPAADGAREITPQLPPAEELLEARDLDGVDTDALDEARAEVERLIADAADDTDTPTVVTALPATGKTTGTVKTARERPLSYLAPRKELQAQALEKADRWGVDARVLPVFSDERVDDAILAAATAHVRESGKDRLRDRWALLAHAIDGAAGEDDDVDAEDLFVDTDEDDDVDLDRPTCPVADGEHGPAWALAVHVARRLGYTPREIHTQARGLFGTDLPCSADDTCPYTAGWEHASDADDTADLLVGSYVHAHVPSVRTAYSRRGDGRVDTEPRAVVLDEFVGEAFVREFDDLAPDHATWLARSLREDVEDRRDLYEGDLDTDPWVDAWLRGEAHELDAVDHAIATVDRTRDLLEAREAATGLLEDVDTDLLDALDLREPLRTVADGADVTDAYLDLVDALRAIEPGQPGAGLESWVRDAVADPLCRATNGGGSTPDLDTVDLEELPIAGDLRRLVEEALDAAHTGDAAEARLDAARTALTGGREGCRRLAAWATDGYAHPEAHHLLEAILADDPDRIHTDAWAFDPRATDGTSVDVVDTGARATTVLDRNGHGALLHTPPARTDADGADVPLVGLDATGRRELWATAIGEDVTVADIHDTAAERAAFLEEALDLRVIQAADRPRYYEGDPTTKDTDGDVALLEALAEEYAGVEAPRERGEEAVALGKPAAITTKGVRSVLEDDPRLDGVVDAVENYGNIKGSNQLGGRRLAAILGCQHYGDHAVERFAALASEAVDTDRRNGRGGELAYGSRVGDAYLAHMTEDQTMQAILRFARGESGATVVARTSALREDLPVVGEGQVVETWSDTATAIARHYRTLGREFTTADVRDVVDVGPRQVRRVLAELAGAGYVRRVDEAPGRATTYERVEEPGAGEVDLPSREEAVASGEGGHSHLKEYYTWNVRVFGASGGDIPPDRPAPARTRGAPPAPATADAVDPPP